VASELQVHEEAVEHLTGALVCETYRVYALEERDASIPELDNDAPRNKGSHALCPFGIFFDHLRLYLLFLFLNFCCRAGQGLNDPSGGYGSPPGRLRQGSG
jgi:hypothetical protein